MSLWLLVLVAIGLIFFFDFTNGFHDASNMVATLIASRSLTPGQAMALVALFTFLGPLIGGTAVANTIGSFVALDDLAPQAALALVLAGVLAAVGWNLLTWYWGMPSSSSHALVGGLVGAVVVQVGADHVVWGFGQLARGEWTGVTKVLLALLISPLLGLLAGFLIQKLMQTLLRAATPAVKRPLHVGQWLTASVLAFAHGANDAQKGMGMITLVLVLAGHLSTFAVPLWVILMSASCLTVGTVLGGWRIVKTVGFGIYRLRPLHGLDAQLGSAAVIFGASLLGGPVSTTHVVSSAIMGVGAAERPRGVHWYKAREMALTWIFTLPGAALLGALLAWPIQQLAG